jgi:hypothetical protein
MNKNKSLLNQWVKENVNLLTAFGLLTALSTILLTMDSKNKINYVLSFLLTSIAIILWFSVSNLSIKDIKKEKNGYVAFMLSIFKGFWILASVFIVLFWVVVYHSIGFWFISLPPILLVIRIVAAAVEMKTKWKKILMFISAGILAILIIIDAIYGNRLLKGLVNLLEVTQT